MTTSRQDLKKIISQTMRRIRQGRIPSSNVIVETAFKELGYTPSQITRDEARASFNGILDQAFAHTLTVLERFENEAYAAGIPSALLELRPDLLDLAEEINQEQGLSQAAHAIIRGLYLELRESFLSVSQSRKSRGGRDFELSFAEALSLAQFPYAMQEKQSRADFILPSTVAFDQNKTISAVASLKRTLRERWTEVVGELVNLRMPNIFLVTADSNIEPSKVKSICDDNLLHLIVWDSVKQHAYPNHPRVLGFTQFANERLPNLESQWMNTGLL